MSLPLALLAASSEPGRTAAAWRMLAAGEPLGTAEDARCDPAVLAELARHPSAAVRGAVSGNPATPAGVLSSLSQDRSSRVRHSAADALQSCESLGGGNLLETLRDSQDADALLRAVRLAQHRWQIGEDSALLGRALARIAQHGHEGHISSATTVILTLGCDPLDVLGHAQGAHVARGNETAWAEAVGRLLENWTERVGFAEMRSEMRANGASRLRERLRRVPTRPGEGTPSARALWEAAQAGTGERTLSRLLSASQSHPVALEELIVLLVYTHPKASVRTVVKAVGMLDDASLLECTPLWGSVEYAHEMLRRSGTRQLISMLASPTCDWGQALGRDGLTLALMRAVRGWELMDMDESYMRALHRPGLCDREQLIDIAGSGGALAGMFAATHPLADDAVLCAATWAPWHDADAGYEVLARLNPDSAGSISWQFACAALDAYRPNEGSWTHRQIVSALQQRISQTCGNDAQAWTLLAGLSEGFCGSVDQMCDLVRDTLA